MTPARNEALLPDHGEPFAVCVDRYLAERTPTSTALAASARFYDRDSYRLTPEFCEARAERTAAWQEYLTAIDPRSLSPGEQVELGVMLAHVRARQAWEAWQNWRRDPSIYAEDSTALRVSQSGEGPMPDRWVQAVRYRLRAVEYKAARARANLTPEFASPVHTRAAIDLCAGHIRFLQTETWTMVPDDVRSGVAAEAGRAVVHWQELLRFLAELLPAARGQQHLGASHYDGLLSNVSGLPFTGVELRDRAWAEYRRCGDEMTGIARSLGFDDWRPCQESLGRWRADDAAGLVRSFQDAIERAHAFC